MSNRNRYNSFRHDPLSTMVSCNADACARRADQACDPLAKAAYREMVRAWLILAITVEELVRQPLHETRGEEQVLAA